MKFRTYFGLRILTWAITIWIGVTIVFFVPRFFPSDPVDAMIGQMVSRGGQMASEELELMRSHLRMQFGLEASLWEQYTRFLINGLFRFDFGPSLMNFPTPASEIIFRFLPYTLGLLLTSTILGWIIGNIIGLLAGFRKNKLSSKILETVAICLYPIPYWLVALVLQIVLGFILGLFPLRSDIFGIPGTFFWFQSLARAGAMPLISILLINAGWWIISMKALSSSVALEDYVLFARFRGLEEGEIGRKYVFRNSILPQITALGLSLGGVFGGAVLVETIFGFPGVGLLMLNAIGMSDYNMIMGCVTISILAVSTATLIVDLVLPFIDPRIRYS